MSLLGWHVSQLTDDIRSTSAVAYRLQFPGEGRVVASIHNVSKTKSLAGVSFAIASRTPERCLKNESATLDVRPPNAVSATEIVGDETAVVIRTTLAAGGALNFGAHLSGVGSAPKFLFVPDESKPLDIYVFDGTTWKGWLIENYFGIVLASFFILLGLLALIMLGHWWNRGSRTAVKKD